MPSSTLATRCPTCSHRWARSPASNPQQQDNSPSGSGRAGSFALLPSLIRRLSRGSMTTRRRFLGSLFAATATVPALRSDALARILPATRHVDGRNPVDVAQDEDFWREIQAAFDIDRGMINLNNGGVAPSPRVVNAAFQRYLAVSNQAPAVTMWGWIEPEIEAVRRRLAANFGCDPEEMAITRNASEALEIVQLGLPLQRGDEVLTTTQDYPRMITTWKQRERRDGIVLKQITFPVP